jgi:hypothetical protein
VISEDLLRVIGAAAWLTLLAGASSVMVGLIVRGGNATLMQLELSGSPEQVEAIVQGPGAGAKRLRHQLWVDYAFLAFYWLTFVGLSIALSREGGAWYDLLGLAAAVAATATAVLDVLENLRSSGLLALSRPSDQIRLQPVEHLRQTSLAKWACSALTLAVLAALFLSGEGALVILGLVFLAVGGLGGLAAAVAWLRQHGGTALMTLFFFGFCLLGLTVALLFTVWPGEVIARL